MAIKLNSINDGVDQFLSGFRLPAVALFIGVLGSCGGGNSADAPVTLATPIATVTTTTTTTTTTLAPTLYTRMIVFGASLSDIGNVGKISGGALPGPQYYQ